MRESKVLSLLLLTIAVFLSFFATLGMVPLFDLDEGAFSEATREMLASGDYLTTYLNGNLRFDKPILIYWLQALSGRLFGLNEFAMRFPSAIAATLWIVGVYRFVRQEKDETSAFYASFFMLSSLQITIIAKAAIADALLNLFIALSMFAIYRYHRTRARRHLYLTFLFIALGTLTKGPVAIMIPFVVSALFFILNKEFVVWLRAIFNPVGIVIFLLVAGPWYLLEYLEQGEKFVEGFFLKHNLQRFESPMEGHFGSFFYYIPVLLIGMLPFTSLILRPLLELKDFLREDLGRFLLLWFGFVFLFFSFSGTKLPHYVIYGYTPLFILAAYRPDRYAGRLGLVVWPVTLYLSLMLLPLWLRAGGLETIADAHARAILEDGLACFDAEYFGAFSLAIVATLVAGMGRFSNFWRIVIVGLVFIVTINFVLLPVVGEIKQQPIKEAASIAKTLRVPITSYRITTPSFNFYLGSLTKRGDPRPGEVVYTKREKLKRVKSYDMIYQKGGVALIKLKEL